MSAGGLYRLAAGVLVVAAVLLLLAGMALVIHPELAPAGQGPNAGGVRVVGAVLLLAGVIKLAVLIALNRFRYRTGALPPEER